MEVQIQVKKYSPKEVVHAQKLSKNRILIHHISRSWRPERRQKTNLPVLLRARLPIYEVYFGSIKIASIFHYFFLTDHLPGYITKNKGAHGRYLNSTSFFDKSIMRKFAGIEANPSALMSTALASSNFLSAPIYKLPLSTVTFWQQDANEPEFCNYQEIQLTPQMLLLLMGLPAKQRAQRLWAMKEKH